MNALLLTEYMKLELTPMPEPEIGPDDVLIRVRACGICGSDVHGFDGSTGRRIPPLVMGHEAAGEVAAHRRGVRDLRPGDRVTFDSTIYCGQCFYCARGEVNLCDNRQVMGVSPGPYRRHGAFAEYVAVPRRIIYRLPDALSFEQAAMIEAVSVAMHAVNLTPVRLGDTAVVVGAGMIGVLDHSSVARRRMRARHRHRSHRSSGWPWRANSARRKRVTSPKDSTPIWRSNAWATRKPCARRFFRAQRRRGDAGGQCFADRGVAVARSGDAANPAAGLMRIERRISRGDQPDGARHDPRGSADQRSGAVGGRAGVVRQAISARGKFDESDTAAVGRHHSRAFKISSATSAAARIARTSCTRTICAPARILAVTAAAVANAVSSGVECARKCFREGPVISGNSSAANSPNRAMISEVLISALAESQSGVEYDARFVDAAVARAAGRGVKIAHNCRHRIGQRTQLSPRFGTPAHVVQNQPRVMIRHHPRQLRFERQSGRIVDNLRPQLDRALGHIGLVGIDRNRNRQPVFEPLQHRRETAQLFVRHNTRATPAASIRLRYR